MGCVALARCPGVPGACHCQGLCIGPSWHMVTPYLYKVHLSQTVSRIFQQKLLCICANVARTMEFLQTLIRFIIFALQIQDKIANLHPPAQTRLGASLLAVGQIPQQVVSACPL